MTEILLEKPKDQVLSPVESPVNNDNYLGPKHPALSTEAVKALQEINDKRLKKLVAQASKSLGDPSLYH